MHDEQKLRDWLTGEVSDTDRRLRLVMLGEVLFTTQITLPSGMTPFALCEPYFSAEDNRDTPYGDMQAIIDYITTEIAPGTFDTLTGITAQAVVLGMVETIRQEGFTFLPDDVGYPPEWASILDFIAALSAEIDGVTPPPKPQ